MKLRWITGLVGGTLLLVPTGAWGSQAHTHTTGEDVVLGEPVKMGARLASSEPPEGSTWCRDVHMAKWGKNKLGRRVWELRNYSHWCYDYGVKSWGTAIDRLRPRGRAEAYLGRFWDIAHGPKWEWWRHNRWRLRSRSQARFTLAIQGIVGEVCDVRVCITMTSKGRAWSSC
jgi:hypothetical protein